MLFDSMLVMGSLVIAYGILKTLGQLSDRQVPGVGVFMTAVGAAMIYWVQAETKEALTWTDLPDALFRLIGALT